MKVLRAENEMPVLPNHVYLIPPKKNLTIFHGKLLLIEQDYSKGINLPIDVFLKALAEDQAERAIAVILSGTGSDGTRGVRHVKEAGGMVMVQHEDTAKFNGMPRAAISTGLTDFILPPEEMPRHLLAYAQHPYVALAVAPRIKEEEGLTRLFSLLRDQCKVDFTYYKPSTVTRRIQRRMTVNHTESLIEYVSILKQNPSEVSALYRELLIGVTSFFRDPEVFDSLAEKWLPELINHAPSHELRFWVAGCSTGEEAYSLAMMVREVLEKSGKELDIKIFATDLDKDAIHYAATGVYPDSIAADLSPYLLSKYFMRRDESYQVSRAIREMVVFAQHNLIMDPPFTNIALISCRNLLIYLQSTLQHRVFEFFSFSLASEGVLVLGTSESTGDMADHFDPVEPRLKIYRSRTKIRPPFTDRNSLGPTDTRSRDLRGQFASLRRGLRVTSEERLLERFVQTLTEEMLPPCVLVNENLEILQSWGPTHEFFRLPSGNLHTDITKMAIKELAVPLATGIQKVFKQRQEVRFSNVRISEGHTSRLIDLRIRLLIPKRGQEDLVAVFVQESRQPEAIQSVGKEITEYDLSKETEERMRDLEQDLQFTRENLQATIEELETSNEELQATNEELLASNEELQSTNEELQSTNEELFTVNAEYQSKIIELTELHNDIDNILLSTQTYKLLIDENMEVRRFSSNITRLFNLLASDVGRPLTHISHNLVDFDLTGLLKDVSETQKVEDHLVQTKEGATFVLRIVPYKIGPLSFSGFILTFTDVEALRKMEQQRDESEAHFTRLFETMPIGVVFQNGQGEIVRANAAAERILGLSLAQLQGRKSIDPRWRAIKEDGSPFPGEEHPAMLALKTGKPVRGVVMGVFNPADGVQRWIEIDAVPQFQPESATPTEVFATFTDITERRLATEKTELAHQALIAFFMQSNRAIAVHEMIFNDKGDPIDFWFLAVTPAYVAQTGLEAEKVQGKRLLEVLPRIEPFWVRQYAEVVQSGESRRIEHSSAALQKTYSVDVFPLGGNRFAVEVLTVDEIEADASPDSRN
jgi:two-component system CheB/CheR fusion protein